MALSRSARWTVYLIGFIVALYGLQWLLQVIFYGLHPDATAIALRPLQNHYYSFSKYYITTEGALGEFTEDSTGVGRMIGPLMIGAILWFVLVAIIGFIKPLEKYNGYIVHFVSTSILVLSVYTSFFAPPQRTTFGEGEIVLEKTNSFFVYRYPSSAKVNLKFSYIDRFEFDFYKSKDLYFDALFLQLFVVIDGKRYMIGENQVDSNDSTYVPSDAQKKEAQEFVDLLTKLIGR